LQQAAAQKHREPKKRAPDPKLHPDKPADVREWLEGRMSGIYGHKQVKEKFRTLFKVMQLEKHKRSNPSQSGSTVPAPHMTFAGNPGVNKTEWARVAASMMYFLGITKTARFVEVKRADLVSQYANGTTEKTKKVLDSAKDGVLFVDEISALLPKTGHDSGGEAIDELMNRLDAPQGEQAVVIVAGYHEGVEKFLQHNDGMDRRIGSENRFVLPDYTCDELAHIIPMNFEVQGYTVDCSVEQLSGLLRKVSQETLRKYNGGIWKRLYLIVRDRIANEFDDEVRANEAACPRTTLTLSDMEACIGEFASGGESAASASGGEPATSEVFKAAKAPAAKALVRFDVNEKQASDVEQSANATAKVIAKTSRESCYCWEDANNPHQTWYMHFKNVSRDEAFTQLCEGEIDFRRPPVGLFLQRNKVKVIDDEEKVEEEFDMKDTDSVVASLVYKQMQSDKLSIAEEALLYDDEFRKREDLYKRLQARKEMGRTREHELRVRQVSKTQVEKEDCDIFDECVRVTKTSPSMHEDHDRITRRYVEATIEAQVVDDSSGAKYTAKQLQEDKQHLLQASKTLVDDDFEFEYAVRFMCGERSTAAFELVEWFVERKEEQLCKPDEGKAASVEDVKDLIKERVKLRIQKLQGGKNCARGVREMARDVGYKPIEQAVATAAISEGMAATLRPLMVAMVEAGRERAKIHFDVDELRAKVKAEKPGTEKFKDRHKQLMDVDANLREASAKFDEVLREALKVADAQTSTWGRQVMMEVLREEVERAVKAQSR
jgi:hypothetical protein